MRKFIAKLYDAEDKILSLETMEKLISEPGSTYGTWFTRQSWRGEINFYGGIWFADLYDGNTPLANYADPDIFGLIRIILESHGK